MAIYQSNLIPDQYLLWHCGLLVPETSQPDKLKIAIFFGISQSTAKRWIARGLPGYARRQLSLIIDGRMLPTNWRGVRLVHDGLWLDSGHHIPLEHLRHWPSIMVCVDWSRVPSLALAKGKGGAVNSQRIN